MKHAIKALENAREKVKVAYDAALEAEIGGIVYSEFSVAETSIKEGLDVLRAAEAAKANAKKKTSAGAEKKKNAARCANCGGRAWKCGGAGICTNASEAPTSPATPAAKKRGRPKGSRMRQQTIDDAILPHRPTDPAPPMPPLPVDAHPLDALAGRVLEQNGAAT